MRELEFVNGRVESASRQVAVCPRCDETVRPTPEGRCVDCGAVIEYREADS